MTDRNDPHGALSTRVLQRVHQDLLIDDAWTTPERGGFSWIAYRLRQRFVASPVPDEEVRVRVSSRIPVVRDVRMAGDQVVRLLAEMNRFSVGESLVWDAREKRVLSHASVILSEVTAEWRVGHLESFALIALVSAETRAEAMAEMLEGSPSWTTHDTSGQRDVPDDMLQVVDQLFRPAGLGESRFANADEFAEIEHWVRAGGHLTFGSSAQGIAVEFPAGNDDTLLFHLQTDQQHPLLGSGVLCTSKLRVPPSIDLCAEDLAGYLNALEVRGDLDGSSLGAWCVDSSGGTPLLVHAVFYPNALYRPGVSAMILADGIARAWWVDEVLRTDEVVSDRDVFDIWYERTMGPAPS